MWGQAMSAINAVKATAKIAASKEGLTLIKEVLDSLLPLEVAELKLLLGVVEGVTNTIPKTSIPIVDTITSDIKSITDIGDEVTGSKPIGG